MTSRRASSRGMMLGLALAVAGLVLCTVQVPVDVPAAGGWLQDPAAPVPSLAPAWTPTMVVSTESTGWSQSPSLAVDGAGNVHVAWDDQTNYGGSGTDLDIFYRRWNATTGTWSITEVVSTESTSTSQGASLAVDGAGNVHVAWRDATDHGGSGTDFDIFYKARNATTGAWSVTGVVSTGSDVDAFSTSLGVDGAGNVHVAWFDIDWDLNVREVFYRSRNATTGSWSAIEVVSTESVHHSMYPSLAVDAAGNVHVAWHDNSNYGGSGTDTDIFYKVRNGTTGAWTVTEVVSTESMSPSSFPSLAVDVSGNVHVAWDDQTNYGGSGTDMDIFYTLRNATTGAWTVTEVVSTESTGWSQSPSLAVDVAGNVHVAWYDPTNHDNSGTDRDIFYKARNATTGTWSITGVISTESTGNSYSPSLAVDGAGIVHVAWYDETNYAGAGTDYDIFYKRLAIPPATPVLQITSPVPSTNGTVSLAWNAVVNATSYHVYRDTSPITSTAGMAPVASTGGTTHDDEVDLSGVYHYVVVAGSILVNSTPSNCESVPVVFPLVTPVLVGGIPVRDWSHFIGRSVELSWAVVPRATMYFVYRDTEPITSTAGLVPIANTTSTWSGDVLDDPGTYHYVVVAGDAMSNSTPSNSLEVTWERPAVIPGPDPAVVAAVVLGSAVLVASSLARRKRPA